MGNQPSANKLDKDLNVSVENANLVKATELLKKGANPNRLISVTQEDDKKAKKPSKSEEIIITNNNGSLRRDSGNESTTGIIAEKSTENDKFTQSDDSAFGGDDVNVYYNRNSLKREKAESAKMNALHRATRAKNNMSMLKLLIPYIKNIGMKISVSF